MKKWLKYFGITTLALILGAYLLFRFALSIDKDPAEIQALFDGAPMQPHHSFVEAAGYRTHVVSIGNPEGPVILFSHGSPGSWDAWVAFFQETALTQSAQLIAYDRPGFGETTPAEPALDLATQAAVLAPILDTLSASRQVIVVGHSFGGPVAVEIACRYPEKIDQVLILAGSVDPDLEAPLFSIQYQLAAPGWRKLLPPALDVCNREILPLKNQLIDQKPCWAHMDIGVCVLQGMLDELVPAGNAAYVEAQYGHGLVGTTLIPEMGHLFVFTEPQRVVRVLKAMMEVK